MLKLEMYKRKTCQKFMPTKSVAKRLFDYILAKDQIFLNEARWGRLENKTPREIMKLDRKTEIKRLL